MAASAVQEKTALGEKLEALGFKPMTPERRWNHGKVHQRSNLSWNHDQLGTIVVGVKGFDIGRDQFEDGYSWARVLTRNRMAGKLTLAFAMNLSDEVKWVFQARGPNVTQCFGNIPDLCVPVSWDDKGIPRSRMKDQDNLDHFLVTEEGVVLQLQTSLVSRVEDFYVCNHELWAAQIVEVTEPSPPYKTVEVDGKRYAFAPLWDTQTYSGADFLVTNGTTGPQVIKMALADGLVPAVVETLPIPDWNPPAFPYADGFEGALVMWFNPNVGAKVITESGEQVFIPLKGILDAKGKGVMRQGDFPIVTPKQQVLLQRTRDNDGKFATIRPTT